jgi:hypothetical protein
VVLASVTLDKAFTRDDCFLKAWCVTEGVVHVKKRDILLVAVANALEIIKWFCAFSCVA